MGDQVPVAFFYKSEALFLPAGVATQLSSSRAVLNHSAMQD